MSESDDDRLKVSVMEFIDLLFQEELCDQTNYDPEIVKLVQEHLGQSHIHSKAGARLAESLIQLAKVRARETSQ